MQTMAALACAATLYSPALLLANEPTREELQMMTSEQRKAYYTEKLALARIQQAQAQAQAQAAQAAERPPIGSGGSLGQTGGLNRPAVPPPQKMAIRGIVIQATSDGCLVDAKRKVGTSGQKAVEGLVMVRGTHTAQGTEVFSHVYPDGWYDYTTTRGASARVPAYRLATVPSTQPESRSSLDSPAHGQRTSSVTKRGKLNSSE